ncbi:MAG: hypothetical protein RSE07_01745, partial [Oscillospiraceae bacterium]
QAHLQFIQERERFEEILSSVEYQKKGILTTLDEIRTKVLSIKPPHSSKREECHQAKENQYSPKREECHQVKENPSDILRRKLNI